MSELGVRAIPWILCVVAAACDAGAKQEPKPAAAPAKKAAEQTPAKPVVGFDLHYLPADTDVVAHVDVARLRKSALWAPYSRDIGKLLAPGTAGCNYDPLTDVSTVDVGVGVDHWTVLVLRGIDRARTLECFRGLKNDSNVSATFDGDVVHLAGSTGQLHVLTFVDPHTMVMMSTQGTATEHTLQQVLQTGAPLQNDPTFGAVMDRTKKTAAVIAASRPNSKKMADSLAQAGMHLTYFYGSIDLTDHFDLVYAMEVKSAEEATQLTTMMKGQLASPQVKQMFDRIEANEQGSTVTLDVSLNEAKLTALSGMLKAMLPAS